MKWVKKMFIVHHQSTKHLCQNRKKNPQKTKPNFYKLFKCSSNPEFTQKYYDPIISSITYIAPSILFNHNAYFFLVKINQSRILARSHVTGQYNCERIQRNGGVHYPCYSLIIGKVVGIIINILRY